MRHPHDKVRIDDSEGMPLWSGTLHVVLKMVLELFEAGAAFTVRIARSALECLDALSQELRARGIRLRLVGSNDPSAADYVVNTLFGSTVGGLLGVGVGAVGWQAVRHISLYSMPAAGPILVAGFVVGTLLGGVGALCVTHWGLTIRLEEEDLLNLHFRPV